MRELFWPIRTGQTFLDVWSTVHLAFWLAVGVFFGAGGVPPVIGCLAILIGAYAWEVLERRFFYRFVKHTEVWFNSFVSDPLMCASAVLGYVMPVPVGLFAAWFVVGGNVEAVRPPKWATVVVVAATVIMLAIVRTIFWPAPWWQAWLIEPATVVAVPLGAWVISKQ